VVLGTILLSCIGSMMHFAYAWTGCQDWAALLFAVNESVYEHGKIMLFPIVFWWCVVFPLCALPLWYTYWSAGAVAIYSAAGVLLLGDMVVVGLGFESLGVDILLFIVSIFCGQLAGYWATGWDIRYWRVGPSLLFAVVVLCVCTYFPPHTPLFEDLRNHTYGRPVKCG
jgi:hypothetical protein